MNIQPNTVSNISDDQELAKALAGVNGFGDADTQPVAEVTPVEEPKSNQENINPMPSPLPLNPAPQRDELEQIKMEVVNELRPLVDKLILPPEEKFDVYLLLIRCTDDRTLVAPAHETARIIEDETRRATALLDIFKEIDYLSAKPGVEENSANIASPIDNQPLV
jgi:bifunctional phosphoglucose/phosphomannose isomerase